MDFLRIVRECRLVFVLAAALGLGLGNSAAGAGELDAVPAAVRGPFLSNPDLMTLLDCPQQPCSGKLNFTKLMEARLPPSQQHLRGTSNPFNLPVAKVILETIQKDLDEVVGKADAEGARLRKEFLTDEGSRVELVGVVNRMDRQFVKDPSTEPTPEQAKCGEISAIYRFGYSIRDGTQKSRLPVTMNLVFPAVPSGQAAGSITCQGMVKRWLDEVNKPDGRSADQILAGILDPQSGVVAPIDGADLLRVEINMQAYRKPASDTSTNNFGTEAGYILRVFRWEKATNRFEVSFLRNQVDRDVLLGDPSLRKKLLAFLTKRDTVISIDKGTLDIPAIIDGKRVLALRAVSISPGGSHRSANQPFWNAENPAQQLMSDTEIQQAIDATAGEPLSFIKSREDFRTRLNETSCTNCHQTRAIAGFHFPGADRTGTSLVNSVLLPGSPQFYGDQPRRMEILGRMAVNSGPRLKEHLLATGYAARPMNRFAAVLQSTQLIGGWGGACLMEAALAGSQRQWRCGPSLRCERLFDSGNDPNVGTCIPDGPRQVGDALQSGTITSPRFGTDRYARQRPQLPADAHDTRIPVSALPSPSPAGNSYYGAHQEFYEGDGDSTDIAVRRDASTGGFPAGMLRLSECINLPKEASCALIASSGFNKCITKLSTDRRYSIDVCFDNFTSYSGMRACTAISPCRDDYICVKPMDYTVANADTKFSDRKSNIVDHPFFQEINRRAYSDADFGQNKPDQDWLQRNDRSGLCIPPYFVFQFRSDGHPPP